MKLKITIEMDNAAFEPDNGTEAARILRKLADEIDGGNYPISEILKPLIDLDGNQVGTARVTLNKAINENEAAGKGVTK